MTKPTKLLLCGIAIAVVIAVAGLWSAKIQRWPLVGLGTAGMA